MGRQGNLSAVGQDAAIQVGLVLASGADAQSIGRNTAGADATGDADIYPMFGGGIPLKQDS